MRSEITFISELENSLTSPSKTNTTLSNKRVPSSTDIASIAAPDQTRAIVPFLLRETELLKNNLQQTLVLFSGPVVGGWL